MTDGSQSTPALIRSAWTLAQSVSTQLIITHDCCDLVPMPRQLELHLRTISYTEMARGRGGGSRGEEGESMGRKCWRRK